MAYDYVNEMAKHRAAASERAATPVFYETGSKKRLTKKEKSASLRSAQPKRSPRGRSSEPPAKDSSMATAKSDKKPRTAKQKKADAAQSRRMKREIKNGTRPLPGTPKGAKKPRRPKGEKKKTTTAKKPAAKKAAKKSTAKKSTAKKASKKTTAKRPSHKPQTRTTKSTIIKSNRSTKDIVVLQMPRDRAPVKSKSKAAAKGKSKSKKLSAKERYPMSNPITGFWEYFTGGITFVGGFLASDVTDRGLATHALTDTNGKDANGNEVYSDTPPTTGAYMNLYNSTAILAPYSASRWLVGGAVTVVSLGLAHFIKAPVGRSAVQMFGFGWGARWLGKGLVDLLAKLLGKTSVGQRLYDAEMRASINKTIQGGGAYVGPVPPTTVGPNGGWTAPAAAGNPAPGPGLGRDQAPTGCGTCSACQSGHRCHGSHAAAPPPPPAPPTGQMPPAPPTGQVPPAPPAPPTGRTTSPVPVIGAGASPREEYAFGLYAVQHRAA
jgi:hypothetical protein